MRADYNRAARGPPTGGGGGGHNSGVLTRWFSLLLFVAALAACDTLPAIPEAAPTVTPSASRTCPNRHASSGGYADTRTQGDNGDSGWDRDLARACSRP